jgi:hypothetical protein
LDSPRSPSPTNAKKEMPHENQYDPEPSDAKPGAYANDNPKAAIRATGDSARVH